MVDTCNYFGTESKNCIVFLVSGWQNRYVQPGESAIVVAMLFICLVTFDIQKCDDMTPQRLRPVEKQTSS